MEERWAIPLAIATMAGFLLGLLTAVLQLTGGSTFAVGLAGVVASCLGAAASIIGCREGRPVAILRALFASLTFLGIFLAMLSFLRDGRPLVAFLWAVFAGVMAGLARRAGDPRRPHEERGDERGAQPA